jgi:hypothetical protein
VEAELNHVREIRRPFFVIKDKNDSSIDPDGTLQREGDPMIYGEWDLSTKDNRQAAFESAAEELNKQIENAHRSRIS